MQKEIQKKKKKKEKERKKDERESVNLSSIYRHSWSCYSIRLDYIKP